MKEGINKPDFIKIGNFLKKITINRKKFKLQTERNTLVPIELLIELLVQI